MTTLTVALTRVRPMVGTVFSHLPDGADPASGALPGAPVALLPRAGRLVLVVPAELLSWHPVSLPPVAGARQRAVLDGLLEDQLLDEPAALALALAPKRAADGRWWVAACDKAWLAGVLQCFEQAGRRVHRVVPALAPVASGDGAAAARWVVCGTPEDARLQVADAAGVLSVPLAQAHALLDAQMLSAQEVALEAEPAVAALAEQVLGRPVRVRTAAQALREARESGWELAQFDLATSGGSRLARRWGAAGRALLQGRRWRALRWGLVAALLAHLVGLQAWAWRLDETLQARRQQVRHMLTQSFPKVRTVVDAPLQMEREVALLRQSGAALTAQDLEPLLAAFGTALPEGSAPGGLEFTTGQLTVKGVALGPEALALLTARLAGQGLSVRQDADRLVVRTAGAPRAAGQAPGAAAPAQGASR